MKMEVLFAAVLGGIIGYLIGTKPSHPQPKTTRQSLLEMPPKCTYCLMCDEPARGGSYFCSEHANLEV
jgi:hypothetical protein